MLFSISFWYHSTLASLIWRLTKNEQVLYKTHVEEYFETVVQKGQDGHYYFKEHRLLSTNANFKALRSSFVNKLIEKIKKKVN